MTTPTHSIRWTFEDDSVSGKIICHAGIEGDCHLVSDCDCESYNIHRDPDGTPYHLPDGGEPRLEEPGERHRMTPAVECNVKGWLEADWMLTELSTGEEFVIGETPIAVSWDGNNYEWTAMEARRRVAPVSRANAAEIVRSISRGEINREGVLTSANLAAIAKRGLAALMPFERDAVVLGAITAFLEQEISTGFVVDDRAPSVSVHPVSGGLPGTGRRR